MSNIKHEEEHSKKLLQYSPVEMTEAVSRVTRRLQEYSKVNRHKTSKDDWPPFQPKHFTGMALIHFRKGYTVKKEIELIAQAQYKGEVSMTESLGDVDVAPITKNLSQIFTYAEKTGISPRTILIEGAPGIGKTTLCKEILFQWSNHSILTDKKLVVLVVLRDPVAQAIQSLQDFVKSYCNFTEQSNSIVEEYIKSTMGESMAVILDGYDELPEHIRNDTNTFFMKLIYQKCEHFLQCTIIVTSRLNVSVELRDVVEQRVEILGFTNENRHTFIMQALGSSITTSNSSSYNDNRNNNNSHNEVNQDAQTLIKYLDMNPAINAYCYIPLNMTILLCLFNEDKTNKLPTNQTEINQRFICTTIARCIRKTEIGKPECSIADFDHIPKPYKLIFTELCRLAYTALYEGKIVWTKNEIQSCCKHLTLSDNWSGLDLLKSVEFFSIKENAKSTLFNFLNLSFQETLAAYYITNLYPYQQIRLLEEKFLNSKYFNIWIMYVGLTSGNSFAFKHFLSGNWLQISTLLSLWFSKNFGISEKHIASKVMCLYLFQCFSEAKNDERCQFVGQLLQDGKIDLSGETLSAVSIHTLGFFLDRSSTKHWKLLNLSNCNLRDTEIKYLNSVCSITKRVISIDEINLSYNSFTQNSAAILVNLFLAWSVKSVKMYSQNYISIGKDRDILQSIADKLSTTELLPIQSEFFTSTQSVLIICNLHCRQIESFLKVNASKKYSSIYLSSCHFGSSYNEITQTMLTLAELERKIYLYNCDTAFIDSVEVITKLKLSSFHYMKHSNITPSELKNVTQQLPGFAITFGEDVLPFHFYSAQNKISNVLDELTQENICSGTFAFGNCVIEDIHNIVSYFNSISTSHAWKYFIVNSDTCLRNLLFQQIITMLKTKTLTDFILNTHCPTDQAGIGVANFIKNSTSLEQLSLLNCSLRSQDILLVCEALTTVNTLLHINLSGNTLSDQTADLLKDGISNNKCLQHLELASCSLHKRGFEVICNVIKDRKLLTLNLSDNFISDKAVDDVVLMITGMKSIENLHMKRCSINHSKMQQLITALSKIKSLKILDLSHNIMSHRNLDVEFILANQCLEYLNISYCQLKEDAMIKLTKNLNSKSIKVLNFSGNQVTDMLANHMATMIDNAGCLQSLYLSNCVLQENGLIKIMNSIWHSLKHLDISCSIIRNKAAECIAHSIEIFIDYLDLAACEFPDEGFGLILNAVENKSVLRKLYLKPNYRYNDNASYNDDSTLADKVSMFITNNSALSHISLSNCGLKEIDLLLITSALQNTKFLSHLDIGSIYITDTIEKKLASTELFTKKSDLRHLDLSYCKWQTNTLFSNILISVMNICTLQYLNCSGCKTDDKQAQYLSGAIISNDGLKQLMLANCALKPAGLIKIFKELRNLTAIKHLDLSNNYIPKEAVAMLADIICGNQIEQLDLSRCFQGVNSSDVLTAIANSVTLQYLNLSYKDINIQTVNALEDIITKNTNLQHLELASCVLFTETLMPICSAVNSRNISTLNLSSNFIEDPIAEDLAQMISDAWCTEKLLMNSCSLTFNGLQVMISALAQIKCLRVLELSHNNISHANLNVSCIVSANQCIEHLNLSYCQLQEDAMVNVLNKLNSINLKGLNFSGNQITDSVAVHMETTIGKATGLQSLCLSECSLQESGLIKIVRSTRCLLKCVDISWNPVNNMAAKFVAIMIARNIAMEYLELSCCEIQEEGLALILKQLRSLANIRHIYVNSSHVNIVAAKQIASIIKDNYNLNELGLSNCHLDEEGLLLIINAIKDKKLRHFDISSNAITNKAAQTLIKTDLFNLNSQLELLDVSNCKWQRNSLSEMFAAATKICHLKCINCSGYFFSDEMAQSLSQSITANDTLEKLILANCTLKRHELTIIFDGLKRLTTIKYLDLYHVSIPKELVCAVVQVLSNNRLEHLNLSHSLQGVNCSDVLTAIAKSVTLQHLDLSYNDISDDEASLVVSAITANKYLHTINITNNKFNDQSIGVTLIAMTSLRSLRTVDIRSYCISDDIKEKIAVLISNGVKVKDTS